MKKFSIFLILLSFLLLCGCSGIPGGELPAVTATPEPTATPAPSPAPTPKPTPTPEPPAAELTDTVTLSDSIGGYTSVLLDGNRSSRIGYRYGGELRMECEEPIAGLYLIWYVPPATFTVETAEETVYGGELGFLHEYIALDTPSRDLKLCFTGSSQLCELRAFGPGTPPEDVQVWLPPCEQADLLVMATHADDDIIFFGGLIAQSIDRDLDVQVCYLVNHYDWQPRPQELLDALWAMGVRHHPIIGPFPDYYVLNLKEAIGSFGKENVLEYQVELIRRFRPLVIAGHDRQGEYGHGAHRLNAAALEETVYLAADGSQFPESRELYGVWDTPKLYLHFAEENPMILDVLTPLSLFDGRTALEVAQEAMLYHVTQLEYAHRPMLEDSDDYPHYDLRRFGLVRSLAGPDTGNDILQHVQRSSSGWVTVP